MKNKDTWRYRYIIVIIAFLIILIYSLTLDSKVSQSPQVTPTPKPQLTIEYIDSLPEQTPEPIEITNLGEFKLTYYTNSIADCGKTNGITAYRNIKAVDGITVAVDPKTIPLGSYLFIEGVGFRIAHDTGGAVKGNRIDVYVNKKTMDRPGYGKVYLLKGGN